MENQPTNVEELFNKLKEYGDVRLDLFKLKSVNKVSGVMSSVLTTLVLLSVLFMIILCISIGIAMVIGKWVGNIYSGFFIVAGIYFIIGLVLYAMRKQIIKAPVSNKLIKEII